MVLEKVKAILAEQFDVEEDKITADTDLQEDLGADSLDVVDLLMSIEDEFEVEVPDEEIENIKTVVHSFLTSRLTHNLLLFFSHLIFERSFLRPLFVLLKKVENLQI